MRGGDRDGEPLLGLSIRMEIGAISELAASMDGRLTQQSADALACVHTTPLDAALGDAAVRKAVTAASPVQYLKAVRLHKARMLILHDGVGAAVAADRVGYQSASQFSREFKRFFGRSPIEDSRRARNVRPGVGGGRTGNRVR